MPSSTPPPAAARPELSPIDPATIRVAAVVVACNGQEWLRRTLGALAAQTHQRIDVYGVDVGSDDDSGTILTEALGSERVARAPARTGFGRAVTRVVRGIEEEAGADVIWLIHDDLVPTRTACATLVGALAADPQLHIVGPKLREWAREPQLAEVGMTIDRFGRAESLLDPSELDQGQHDVQREVLYVSTAGMMLRRGVLRAVGGFDSRYPAFRDDLDVCWRAWLIGLRVEVVPAAVAYHVGAASRGVRPVGKGRSWEARYLAERHTLATVLKNTGALRLVWLAPLILVLLTLRVVAFVATRRAGAAIATLRALAWNLVQLPVTLRRRRRIQRRRRRAESEVTRLLAPGLPRVRAYAEALGGWLAGGDTRALLDDEDVVPPELVDSSSAFVGWVKRHPAGVVGLVLAAAYLFGASRLLGPGQLVGGEVVAWPGATGDLWRAWTTPVPGDPLAAPGFASPIQAVLAVIGWLTAGSAYAAQRIVVLGLVPLAFALALRAGRLISAGAGPRVLGAALYALNPVVLGALAEGRLDVLVVAALLPGALLVAARAGDGSALRPKAWRASALLVLSMVVMGAAAPSLLVLVWALWLLVVAGSALRPRDGRWRATGRVAASGLIATLILSPWVASLVAAGWVPALRLAAVDELPLWRALLAVPETLPGVAGSVAPVALVVAVVVAALAFGFRSRPLVVAALLAGATTAGVVAWLAVLVGVDLLWPPALMLPGALAYAGLGAVAARFLGEALGRYSFGWIQVSAAVLSGVVAIGLAGGVARILDDPWSGLIVGPGPLPAFVTADEGQYRILVLDVADDAVRWDVVSGEGPDLTRLGAVPGAQISAAVSDAVAATIGGSDPSGPGRLGALNVRYVVVADPAAMDLRAALGSQPNLEPLPSGGPQVFAVASWLPRAAVIGSERAAALDAGTDPGPLGDDVAALAPTGPASWAATVPTAGVVALAEAPSDGLALIGSGWRARAGGSQLTPVDLAGGTGFALDEAGGRVELTASNRGVHTGVLVVQGLLVALTLSVVLRPPRTSSHDPGSGLPLPPADSLGETSPDAPTGAAPPQPSAAPHPRTTPGAGPAADDRAEGT